MAASNPAHVGHLFTDKLTEIEEKGTTLVQLGRRTFPISKQFLSDIALHPLLDEVGRIGKALMVFHSLLDRIVGIEHAREIYEAAKHSKSLVSLDTADQMLNRPEDSEFVVGLLAVWAARYVVDP